MLHRVLLFARLTALSLGIVGCGMVSAYAPAADQSAAPRASGVTVADYLPLVAAASAYPAPTATPPPATSTATPPPATSTATPPPVPDTGAVLETFEAAQPWRVQPQISGGGASVTQVSGGIAGTLAARLRTGASNARAYLVLPFSAPAAAHQWEERPGSWDWQRASVYLPVATVAGLGPSEYLTLGGLWPSAGGPYGWFLRVRQGGALYVSGYTADGAAAEFPVSGTLPLDRWVELELGLHTQAGPGVKRAFAVVVDGAVYGWYRQGHMAGETFDRAGIGLLDTNSAAPLELLVDQWRVPTAGPFPGGPDARSTAPVQTQDFRTQQGAGVQYDWSTWALAPTLHPQFGLSSAANRLQAGRNLDRMPGIADGWAEIEIDWPSGKPNVTPDSYFGPMVGFHKELNREENLEVIPIGAGNGDVKLVLEAWVGNPVLLAEWPLPLSSFGGSHIPEPGDIIRVRWAQQSATGLDVRASFYDASAQRWYADVIHGVFDVSHVDDSDASTDAVNFLDGYHATSSVTIDSTQYSIRRYTVGTLPTAP